MGATGIRPASGHQKGVPPGSVLRDMVSASSSKSGTCPGMVEVKNVDPGATSSVFETGFARNFELAGRSALLLARASAARAQPAGVPGSVARPRTAGGCRSKSLRPRRDIAPGTVRAEPYARPAASCFRPARTAARGESSQRRNTTKLCTQSTTIHSNSQRKRSKKKGTADGGALPPFEQQRQRLQETT